PSDLVADVLPADDLGGEPTADLSSPDDLGGEPTADLSSPDDLGGEPTADLSSPDGAASDDSSEPIDLSSVCPIQTVRIGDICMDRWEAPNKPGARPLVMYSFYEAEAWCKARGKRLCYDDEWQNACEGPKKWKYPYGDLREPGRCNDDKTWLTYSATKLALWPSKAATSEIETLEELFAKVKATGPNGVTVVNHLEALYQAEGNGENPECVGPSGVEDLVGSVEEWTRRRDGGSGPEFSGNLKGRFWAESRTCQSSVLVHANAFRFYEIGFRCCMDRP
ncbi:MAG: SUMF1/EgtB/PvdO family nonheme iron enzyme, partial [Myxococcales bacterium]|nr:SUMF1/EgtB/PvdO family nonheme iron enzyme [Myxococcales bacterium]